MRRGQLTLVGFVITFIVVVMAIAMAPIVKSFATTTAENNYADDSGPEKWVLYLLPVIIVVAALMGFFVWNSTVAR